MSSGQVDGQAPSDYPEFAQCLVELGRADLLSLEKIEELGELGE
jgi:hypothetical protein